MLHDRLLVDLDGEPGERRSSGGIVIPATAQMGKRLAWATVVAVGANVRTVEIDDRVLFDPDDRAEVELHGSEYILLRERDVHAVAAERIEDGATGLYLWPHASWRRSVRLSPWPRPVRVAAQRGRRCLRCGRHPLLSRRRHCSLRARTATPLLVARCRSRTGRAVWLCASRPRSRRS